MRCLKRFSLNDNILGCGQEKTNEKAVAGTGAMLYRPLVEVVKLCQTVESEYFLKLSLRKRRPSFSRSNE